MDIVLLWFKCKDVNCNYSPVKTKKDKIKRFWRYGDSITKASRPRIFMRYAEGHFIRKDNGSIMIFECKYGSIVIYDEYDRTTTNSHIDPITDKEICNQCIERIKNEGALFQ